MKELWLLLFILLFSFLFPRSSEAVKPLPPIQLAFEQKVLSGAETQIEFTVKTNIETQSVLLSVELPSDFVLTGGVLSWEGPVKAGSEKKIQFTIQHHGKRSLEIEGRATIRLPDGSSFIQKNRFALSPQNQRSATQPSPTRRQGRHGTILEFKGN